MIHNSQEDMAKNHQNRSIAYMVRANLWNGEKTPQQNHEQKSYNKWSNIVEVSIPSRQIIICNKKPPLTN